MAKIGTVEVDVTLTDEARRIASLDRAVQIEIAHARSGNGYHGDRVVEVAKAFEKYLQGESHDATPEAGSEPEEAAA